MTLATKNTLRPFFKGKYLLILGSLIIAYYYVVLTLGAGVGAAGAVGAVGAVGAIGDIEAILR